MSVGTGGESDPRDADARPEGPAAALSDTGRAQVAPGLHPRGSGPASLAMMLSDRAGEESFDNHPVSALNDPLARVLRMLDAIAAPDSAADGETVDTFEQTAGDTLAKASPAEGSSASGRPTAAAPGSSATQAPAGTTSDRKAADADSAEVGPAEVGPADVDSAGVGPAGAPAGPASSQEPRPTAAAQSRSEIILDGAARLFAERGYHGASLRDISREVGISHPGMLHHFASKDALLGAVIDRMEDHAQGLLDSTERIATSVASLDAALGGPWNPKNHLMGLLATLSSEVVSPHHPGRYRIARLRLVHEHVLEEVLQVFADRGDLTPGADPAFVARSTFSLLLSLAVRERSVRALQRVEKAEPVADVHAFVRHYLLG